MLVVQNLIPAERVQEILPDILLKEKIHSITSAPLKCFH